MSRIVDGDRDGRARTPGMTVEGSADHVPVGFRLVVRVGSRVEPDEAVPLLLEPVVEEVIEHVVRDRQDVAPFAVGGCIERDNVVVLEVVAGEVGRAALGAAHVEQARLLAELRQGDFGRGEGVSDASRNRAGTRRFV